MSGSDNLEWFFVDDAGGQIAGVIGYADGVLLTDNGQRAGIGVHWGNIKDVSERLPGASQTEPRAQLLAMIRAIETHHDPTLSLEVRTHSEYAVRCCTSYPTWRANGWKTGSGNLAANLDFLKRLAGLLDGAQFDFTPAWMDEGSADGDWVAKRLAEKGARLPVTYDRRPGYLDIWDTVDYYANYYDGWVDAHSPEEGWEHHGEEDRDEEELGSQEDDGSSAHDSGGRRSEGYDTDEERGLTPGVWPEQGNVRPDVKQERKPSAEQERKPDTKPDIKPDVKPDTQPDIKPKIGAVPSRTARPGSARHVKTEPSSSERTGKRKADTEYTPRRSRRISGMAPGDA